MVWVHRLYALFLGIILSITTGFGLAAFYPQPVMPKYPTSTSATTIPQSCYSTPQEQASPACQELLQKQKDSQEQDITVRQKYDAEVQVYQNKNAGYTRTAVFFGIAIGAIFATVGIGVLKISKLVATGLMLASILTAVLTRFLISLASLGASVATTTGADSTAYLEFGVLFILSIAVIVVGLYNLKSNETP